MALAELKTLIGTRLLSARKNAGFRNTKSVEEKLNGEIKTSTLYSYEQGNNLPPLNVIITLAELYNKAPEYLAGLIDSSTKVTIDLSIDKSLITIKAPHDFKTPETSIMKNDVLHVDARSTAVNSSGLWVLERESGAVIVSVSHVGDDFGVMSSDLSKVEVLDGTAIAVGKLLIVSHIL